MELEIVVSNADKGIIFHSADPSIVLDSTTSITSIYGGWRNAFLAGAIR
jgi:hypothetical protein